jgi:hypothetical protein
VIQRILNSKNFIAFVLASATGMTLYFLLPFPEGNLFLRLIAAKAPLVYSGAKYSYIAMLFTTPYIILSILLSGLYIFTLKIRKRVSPARLPAYPDAQHRDKLFLVVGEVHDPRKPVPAENPHWLTIPERGLYTGIAILGAVGTGKTSCCMYPFAEQLIAYKAQDEAKRIGGLVLEVKGDFCHKVRGILERYQRAEDYIEVSLHSEYRYNPLHNDLDAYALAYSIAALLNNLFGKGKEPFWQQAYTNLVKFIILLHKVAYDYVTLFDVYECAISPEVLEKRIEEAEKKLSKFFIEVTPETYTAWVSDLKSFSFELDKPNNVYRAKAITELCDILRNKKVPFQFNADSSSDRDFRKWEQLEAVKRWFHYDWKRIEPKLRTSIVEGISVFLSLFDDNPDVKRTFCPPVECYDPVANADHRYGKPLPSFTWLVETGKVCALNFPIGMNAGLAKALGVMMKLDFQRAVLNRVPEMERTESATSAKSSSSAMNTSTLPPSERTSPRAMKSSSAFRDSRGAFPSWPRRASVRSSPRLPGDTWRSLLQTFRTKIFLALSDDFSAQTASELCGKEDRLKVSYNFSESGHDARVSFLSGKAISNRANVTASKSYNTRTDYRFRHEDLHGTQERTGNRHRV